VFGKLNRFFGFARFTGFAKGLNRWEFIRGQRCNFLTNSFRLVNLWTDWLSQIFDNPVNLNYYLGSIEKQR